MNQQQLVNQIIKARKIQKDRVEQSNAGIEKQKQAIKNLYEPIVEAVDRSTDVQNRQLQQLEHTMKDTTNRNIAAIRHHLPQLQFKDQHEQKRKMIQTGSKRRRLNETSIIEEEDEEEDEFHDTMSQEEAQEESLMDYSEYKPKKVTKWIQQLYQNYAADQHQRITPFDINLKTGQVGEKGVIDIPALLNENKLTLEVDEKRYHVPDNMITEGFMTLLLVPYSSIKEFELKYNDVDIINYVSFMKTVGIKKTSAQKYTKIIKPFLEEQPKVKRIGKGVLLKSMINDKNSKCVMNSQDLFDKLKIIVGSYRAGNNSSQMRNEMRNIVDKLYKVNEIPFTIHKRFYEMYHL